MYYLLLVEAKRACLELAPAKNQYIRNLALS